MNTAVYHISRGYRKLSVWEGSASGQRICWHTITPDKTLTRFEKYRAIVDVLVKRFLINAPIYIPAAREREITAMQKEAGRWTE